MMVERRVKNLIRLDIAILVVSLLLVGVDSYFAYIIFNPEVKEVFNAFTIIGVLSSIISTTLLIKDVKMLPKKVTETALNNMVLSSN